MLDNLSQKEQRYKEIDQLMADPQVASDVPRLIELGKERAALEPMVMMYRKYILILESIDEAKAIIEEDNEPELVTLAREEIATLSEKRDSLEQKLRVALTPSDPNNNRDVFVEIRAAAGGQEAALFVAELYRMYTRYAQRQGWQVDMVDARETGIGGFKEAIFEVKGQNVYQRLKHESGAHRVQRVPVTESAGRLQTSTVTVAVLPVAEDVEVEVNDQDLRIDIYHSGGAGGQNVNKVATAVRITHIPSGIVALCQDERSQLRNKQKAMAVLKARLLDKATREQQEAISQDRRAQVGTGDRAEKIRTYNFPQDRISDHRIDLTLHNIQVILDGDLDPLVEPLLEWEQAQLLAEGA
ncbi:MAG: peptide chain release factor 1 [Chloroflexi bacterium]|nr:peptide chain release factor 1 [Chloroflexota bacterium]